ncbi:alpha/beta fold hydrolase [Streptomyces sp. AV19]|uniref:alpha/beta hydrolase n=1 Tax=Streptomyces sp. AV19 TaxID=2793068 RepID=UPI0018FE06B6|nr:alpha/beta fold hydrolase [Streptomyces sp. AV19]MBH1936153.1 alpha/beta fold hydrolase [Streptomyces sp. AV19]MDG4534050.1 alpha/beta hydrolase [Streptomyces sp. AV19]
MTSKGPGDFARPCVSSITSGGHRIVLLTADGVRVEAAYEPGAGGAAIVLAHGFGGALDRPALRRAAEVFARRAAVVTFSFRGHGRSGGRSTVGDREVLDLAAAVWWARALGHRRVVTVGFSMGGSVVLRHGGLYVPGTVSEHEGRTGAHAEAHADAVVSVSSPARWFYRGTAPMRRLHWAVTRPSGRVVTRLGLRTRVLGEEWDPVPVPPVAAVERIAPRPLLIVHGDRDAYFPLDHPRSLAAAGDPASTELWIERGFGHAEGAAGVGLLERIARWAIR